MIDANHPTCRGTQKYQQCVEVHDVKVYDELVDEVQSRTVYGRPCIPHMQYEPKNFFTCSCLNKKQLVHYPKCKKQRLVDIVKTKKQTSIIAPFFKIFKSFFLLFPKIFNLFDIFKKQRLYKVEKLRNKNCIKDAKN